VWNLCHGGGGRFKQRVRMVTAREQARSLGAKDKN
jgi:hypothetical protein